MWCKEHFLVDGWNESDAVWGWTQGEKWNGFECPHFEKSEAEKIASIYGGWFDDDYQAFFIPTVDYPEDPEIYGYNIWNIDGELKKLWAVGSWCWTWYKFGLGEETHESDPEFDLEDNYE